MTLLIDWKSKILADAIRGQALADVPVGAFLSGGIDSSLIVALYRKHTTGTIRTFSIGFEEAGFNEADYAKEVAAHDGAIARLKSDSMRRRLGFHWPTTFLPHHCCQYLVRRYKTPTC